MAAVNYPRSPLTRTTTSIASISSLLAMGLLARSAPHYSKRFIIIMLMRKLDVSGGGERAEGWGR